MEDSLEIAGRKFSSRLMVGTGRHRSMEEMVESVTASETEIITVAIAPTGPGQPEREEHPRLLRLGPVHDPAQYCRLQDCRRGGVYGETRQRSYRF